MGRFSGFMVVALALLGLLLAAPASAAFTVTPGTDPAAVLKGAVRYRSFTPASGGLSGGEIFLGIPDLAVGTNRVVKDFYGGSTCSGETTYGSWQMSPSVNHVVFSYDPAEGKAYTTVTSSHTYCLEYPTGNLDGLNYLQLEVVNRAAGTIVGFDGVTVNGIPIGDFPAIGWQNWMITGEDLTAGFTIEGDLVLGGTPTGQELNKLEIKAGYLEPPSMPVPEFSTLVVPLLSLAGIAVVGILVRAGLKA